MAVHNQRQLRRGTSQVLCSFCTLEENSFKLHCLCMCQQRVCCILYYMCCVYPQDEYVQFLRQSHEEALKEEERRYRFLAEKHCGLIQSIAHLMNKVYDLLQIALLDSIFHGLCWVIDFRCRMNWVCRAAHGSERKKDAQKR